MAKIVISSGGYFSIRPKSVDYDFIEDGEINQLGIYAPEGTIFMIQNSGEEKFHKQKISHTQQLNLIDVSIIGLKLINEVISETETKAPIFDEIYLECYSENGAIVNDGIEGEITDAVILPVNLSNEVKIDSNTKINLDEDGEIDTPTSQETTVKTAVYIPKTVM